MSSLVYRVHSVPETVNDFLFDFGVTRRELGGVSWGGQDISRMGREALGLWGVKESSFLKAHVKT